MVTTQLIVDVMTFFEDKKMPKIPQEERQPKPEADVVVQVQQPKIEDAAISVKPGVA